MERQHGPWKIRHSNLKYRNEFLELRKDRVLRPDGEPGTYAMVELKPGVCVLALDDEDQVHLVRQFRYALGSESLEAVAGARAPDEDAQAAAARELREELGAEAERWTDLGALDLDTSIVHSPVRLFLAHGLRFGQPEREGTETMQSVRLPLQEAVQRVLRSEITHAATAVLVLKAAHALQQA